MPASVPAGIPASDELDVGLVDERRRLKGLPGSEARELGGRELSQLAVDERQEVVGGALPAGAQLAQ